MITLDLRVLYFFILEVDNEEVSFDFIPHPVHVKGSFQYTIKVHLPPVAWLTCHLCEEVYCGDPQQYNASWSLLYSIITLSPFTAL